MEKPMSKTLLIDLNRGVEIRKHRTSGMQIFMYRDTPGVYLNAFAKEVSENLAKEAGFPVQEYARKRTAKARMAKAMSAIEAELAVAEEDRPVLAERGGYKVVGLGLGRAQITDEDGNALTDEPVAQDYALKLLTELAGPEVDTSATKGQNAGTSKDKPVKETSHGRTAS
jgi:hypothetical protein